jgi:hypothetical protein
MCWPAMRLAIAQRSVGLLGWVFHGAVAGIGGEAKDGYRCRQALLCVPL